MLHFLYTVLDIGVVLMIAVIYGICLLVIVSYFVRVLIAEIKRKAKGLSRLRVGKKNENKRKQIDERYWGYVPKDPEDIYL